MKRNLIIIAVLLQFYLEALFYALVQTALKITATSVPAHLQMKTH